VLHPPPREDVYFEQTDRVRLWFKVKDLLPTQQDNDLQVTGDGMAFLEENLQRNLGKLRLAVGVDAAHRIQEFVMTASQNELCEVIRLIPVARFAAHSDYLRSITRADRGDSCQHHKHQSR